MKKCLNSKRLIEEKDIKAIASSFTEDLNPLCRKLDIPLNYFKDWQKMDQTFYSTGYRMLYYWLQTKDTVHTKYLVS